MYHVLILQAIAGMQSRSGDAVSVGELSCSTEIPKSTLHRYLRSLVKTGTVCRASRGKYQIDKSSDLYASMIMLMYRN